MKRHSGKNIAAAAALVTMLVLSSCGGAAGTSGAAAETSGAAAETSGAAGAGTEKSAGTDAAGSAKKELTAAAIEGLPMVDMSKWQYNAEDDVYWQVGIPYCASPADEIYETMGFFVPGAYFAGTDNGDGTWTCEKEDNAECGGYIADTAPVILPVNTPGYSAMSAPESYDSNFGYGSVTDYTKEGMVLAVAGCRGREHGAPAEVAGRPVFDLESKMEELAAAALARGMDSDRERTAYEAVRLKAYDYITMLLFAAAGIWFFATGVVTGGAA